MAPTQGGIILTICSLGNIKKTWNEKNTTTCYDLRPSYNFFSLPIYLYYTSCLELESSSYKMSSVVYGGT